MNIGETTVSFNDCAEELQRVIDIRQRALRELVASAKMKPADAHAQLAKLKGCSQIISDSRVLTTGAQSQKIQQKRNIKTVL